MKLKYYIDNSEQCLALVSNSHKKAKTEFLKILYGGNIKNYNQNYDNEVEGNITKDGFTFLQGLKQEVDNLMILVWNKHEYLHDLKTGQDEKIFSKKTHPKASLMSLIFQTEERKILLEGDRFLQENGCFLGVFINDGGLVEKLEGKISFPGGVTR